MPRLASVQGRNDETPNKDLGKDLAERKDIDGIREVAQNLANSDSKIQVDCLAVLEQVGLLAPELIEEYVSEFLQMIFSKNNRLVWSAMIALALIADRKPKEIFAQYEAIIQVIRSGSVITQDNGIKTLAKVASTSSEYEEVIFPYLLERLVTCRSKSLPQYAESIRVAVNAKNQNQYLEILDKRFAELTISQQKRVEKLLKAI